MASMRHTTQQDKHRGQYKVIPTTQHANQAVKAVAIVYKQLLGSNAFDAGPLHAFHIENALKLWGFFCLYAWDIYRCYTSKARVDHFGAGCTPLAWARSIGCPEC